MREAIDETNRRFVEAFSHGDMEGVASVYSEDAVLLPPDAAMVRGRTAIKDFWQGVREMGVKEAALETVEVQHEGTTAYEIGAYTLNIQTPGAEQSTQRGKYVVVWKRQNDGSWNWAIDIWNSD